MKINEVTEKETMTKAERYWRQRIIAMLKDDGHGHRHAGYAKVFANYIFHIEPLDSKQFQTAAMNSDEGIIHVNEGFLIDEDHAAQLPVLIRHEILHDKLEHQARMARRLIQKFGDVAADHILHSASIHDLENIIMDDEISNKKYTEDDKKIVRAMRLNGELIGGLVTEDHRENWKNMDIVEMFDAVEQETNQIKQEILNSWDEQSDVEYTNDFDIIHSSVKNAYRSYTDINGPIHYDEFRRDLGKLIASSGYQKWSPKIKDIVETLYNNLSDPIVTADDITYLMKQIVKTSPLESCDIINPHTGEVYDLKLYTPEEKEIAMDVLKNLKDSKIDQYTKWFDKVKQILGDPKYTDADRQKILDALKATKGE